jgi:hypothetical protein
MSLPDTEHLPPPRHRPQRLRTVVTVVYATLLVLALTIPQAVPNWLKGFEPGQPRDLLLDVTLAVQSFSNSMGADRPYHELRRLFLDATGKRED